MRHDPSKRQRGQALVEFLMCSAAVLLPLFLLIPFIARLQDVTHAAEMASRYLAFEATTQSEDPSVWRPLDDLAQEVRVRFFGDVTQPLVSNLAIATPGRHAFWTNASEDDLVGTNAMGISVSTGPAALGQSVLAGYQATHDADALSTAIADALGLAQRGMYTANVNVQLTKVAPAATTDSLFGPLAERALSLGRSMTVLTGGWTARSPDDVQTRLGQTDVLVPSVALQGDIDAAAGVVRKVDAPGNPSGPNPSLSVWKDAVPADRIAQP